jgi:TetR/AcrR family transcriptional regulator
MTTKSKNNRDKGTVRKILDTAAKIFAEVGFAGARVDEIANRAGVNKATIYYHIGGKEALYAAVLRDALSGEGATIANTIDPTLLPDEKLRRYIRKFHQIVQTRPLIPSIMLREAASGGKNFPAEVIQDFIAMFTALSDILEDGVRQGIFVRTSPMLIHLMIVMPMGAMLKLAPLVDQMTNLPGTEQLTPYQDIDTAQEIEDLVLRALRPWRETE